MQNYSISFRKQLLYIKTKYYLGKGWDKLMHGKLDSSEKRRQEHDDSDSDELDTEDEEEKNGLDMNIAYEEEEVADCGDAGDN